MRQSFVQQRGAVSFPAFTGERVYMHAFDPQRGLSDHLRRWQATVDAMLDGVVAGGLCYLMIDQAPVRAGSTHRRPGLHVDGYWLDGSHGPGRHGGHSPAPTHYVPGPHHAWDAPRTRHAWEMPSRHRHCHAGDDREALILATDYLGCAAYLGSYDALPADGGDCSHISRDGLERVDLEPGRVWAGHTLTMLHEAVPVISDCLRTVVRINVQGWAP